MRHSLKSHGYTTVSENADEQCYSSMSAFFLFYFVYISASSSLHLRFSQLQVPTDIIRLPRLFRFLQKPLAQFISVVRAPKSKEGYASIGGGSPLRRITDAQA
ncbi:hypothetical protein CUMW_038290 [Citrus unshiu]|nr:hypothetical protein CUMW_038290 [Citrus unshiu]